MTPFVQGHRPDRTSLGTGRCFRGGSRRDGDGDVKKFFILGCPRSGTTMLQQALNRHSRVVIPSETRYFSAFLGYSCRHQRQHVERLNRDLQIRLPGPDRRITTDGEARAFFDQMARLYLERLGRPDAYFGEKSPAHTGRLLKIKKVFPGAKFLFIYRDGRDVALSLRKVPWTSNDIRVNFCIWMYYGWLLRHALQCHDIDLLCVKYEDLATNPAAELTRILTFLGLGYEARVAEGYGNSEGIPPHEYGWKSRALGRITPDRIGIWRRELSDTEVRVLERLGAGTLESLGYPLTTGRRARLSPGFYARLSWNLLGLAWRLPRRLMAQELVERLAGSHIPRLSGKSRSRDEIGAFRGAPPAGTSGWEGETPAGPKVPVGAGSLAPSESGGVLAPLGADSVRALIATGRVQGLCAGAG